ncbi:MAG: lysophospholipid acyltransferase family protein [Acidimicrobiales bacterium]
MAETWKSPGRSGRVLYAVAALFFGGLVTVFARLRVAKQRGRRRAARALPDGPIIIVSNHAGYADGVLLALVCRRMGRSVRLLATAGVFRAPLIGSLARRLGFIPVARGTKDAAGALAPAAEALAAGEAVAIFPEGRTTRDPNHWPERAKTGAVRLALQSGAPIVPVAMVGTHRVLGRGASVGSIMVNVVLRPAVLTDVGEPIDVQAMAGDAPLDNEGVRELTDRVWARIVALVEALREEAAPDPSGVMPDTDEGDTDQDLGDYDSVLNGSDS